MSLYCHLCGNVMEKATNYICPNCNETYIDSKNLPLIRELKYLLGENQKEAKRLRKQNARLRSKKEAERRNRKSLELEISFLQAECDKLQEMLEESQKEVQRHRRKV